MRKHFVYLAVCCLPLLQSCDSFPKDPEHTLERVRNGTLVVGYSENPPWVVKTAHDPTGIEPEIIKAFAKTLHANIKWQNDTEQTLFEELEKTELDLVIAGITNDTPWKAKVALTRPYLTQDKEKHVLAAVRGENAFIVKLERFLHAHQQELRQNNPKP